MTRNKPPARATATPSPMRYQAVDVLRGTAIVLMIAYHFCFDLMYFGVLQINMYRDPFWVASRSFILSLFLLAMGVSLYLATRTGVRWGHFWRRIGLLTTAAGLVSAGSYFVFPDSWIFFGVLHFIAVASVLGLAFRRLYWANLALGAGLVAIGVLVSHPFFDQNVWQWFGLMTHRPITEDYVPLLPWFGVVLVGVWLGRAVYGKEAPVWARKESGRALVRGLAWGGKHSLLIYLAHQPVLFGILWLALAR